METSAVILLRCSPAKRGLPSKKIVLQLIVMHLFKEAQKLYNTIEDKRRH
jgi:hypothetical protein